ncbi:hypothetical protein BJ138DRAFT_941467 [Hygrophoropsis aurantiaca]|uniref:Uncharacterized protein n=1 Tax=Hygrophoropsis aurantiaca TaxID=72124 RepID=A0ACB8ADU1_9AGAM|nr:hypothetical protein BJ138DRAFT_941467 [Hygrophoropsis aurantiaca]
MCKQGWWLSGLHVSWHKADAYALMPCCQTCHLTTFLPPEALKVFVNIGLDLCVGTWLHHTVLGQIPIQIPLTGYVLEGLYFQHDERPKSPIGLATRRRLPLGTGNQVTHNTRDRFSSSWTIQRKVYILDLEPPFETLSGTCCPALERARCLRWIIIGGLS